MSRTTRQTRTPAAPEISAEPPAVTETPDNEPRGRQGIQNQPECPYCSKPDAPVVCKSNRSDPFFTRYYCPNKPCSYSMKVPRPKRRQNVAQDEFSAR